VTANPETLKDPAINQHCINGEKRWSAVREERQQELEQLYSDEAKRTLETADAHATELGESKEEHKGLLSSAINLVPSASTCIIF